MNKEEVYDSEIFPLMGRIIDICREHKIAMLASFSIPTDEAPDVACTTALWGPKGDDEWAPPDGYAEALTMIRHPIGPPMRITERDREGSVTSETVIFP